MLTTDGYKKLATQSLSATDLPGVLDGIYTSLGLTSWSSHSGTRTPGTNGWSVGRVQSGGVTEAVWAKPTGAVSGIYQMIVWAGAKSGTHSSVAMAQGTYANGQLLQGLWVGTTDPSLGTWDAASPVSGTGYWLGYHPHSSVGTGSTSSWNRATVYESSECIILDTLQATTGSIARSFGGAIIEPNTASTGQVESNGRMYGQCSLGTGSALSTAMLDSSNNAGRIFYHQTAGTAAVGMFRVKSGGASSSYGCYFGTGNGAVSASLSTGSRGFNLISERHRMLLEVHQYSSLQPIGWLRSMWSTQGGAVHGPYSDGTECFILGPHLSSTGDALMIRRAS